MEKQLVDTKHGENVVYAHRHCPKCGRIMTNLYCIFDYIDWCENCKVLLADILLGKEYKRNIVVDLTKEA